MHAFQCWSRDKLEDPGQPSPILTALGCSGSYASNQVLYVKAYISDCRLLEGTNKQGFRIRQVCLPKECCSRGCFIDRKNSQGGQAEQGLKGADNPLLPVASIEDFCTIESYQQDALHDYCTHRGYQAPSLGIAKPLEMLSELLAAAEGLINMRPKSKLCVKQDPQPLGVQRWFNLTYAWQKDCRDRLLPLPREMLYFYLLKGERKA